MATLEPKSGECVRDVHINDDTISVDLFDGRTITVPSRKGDHARGTSLNN